MTTQELAEKIYNRLKANEADIGTASIMLIRDELEFDLPESKEVEKTTPEFPAWTDIGVELLENQEPQYNVYRFLKHWYYRVIVPYLRKSDGWIPVSERLPKSTDFEVIGFNKEWIDPDFNPKGQRVCFVDDDGFWMCAKWSDSAQQYITEVNDMPTYWRYSPTPPQDIVTKQ